MDGPNNGPQGGPQGQSPQGQKRDLIYADNMRQREAKIVAARRIVASLAEPYQNYAAQRINATYTDQQNLWYSIMGVNVAQTRKLATIVFAEICGLNGRPLDQPVANAVVESFRSINRVSAACDWVIFVGITAVVFRNWRRQLSHGMKGWQRYWYPTTRIVGYTLLGYGFVSPLLRTTNQLVHGRKLTRDPRLQGVATDGPQLEKLDYERYQEIQSRKDEEIRTGGSAGYENRDRQHSQDGQDSGSYDDASPNGSWQTEPKSSIQEQATAWRQQDTDAQNQATWNQGSSSQSNNSWSQNSEPAPIQPNSSWDSADPVDDASPTAQSSARADTRPGESTWERLRRQAGVQSRQPQQPRQQQPPPPPSQEGWGENTDTSSQFGGSSRGSSDDYTYTAADVEKSTAKDQAQREFDKLLDRERKGVDQENKRWR